MKKKILELLQKLPFEKIKEHPLVVKLTESYRAIPPQRKKLVHIGGVCFGIFLIYLMIQGSVSYLNSLKQDIEFKRKEVVGLAQDYDQLMRQHKPFLDDLQKKIQSQEKWIPKEYFIEFLKRQGIDEKSIESIEDTPNRTFENLTEYVSKISLNRVSLKQISQVLSNVTKSEKTLSIQNVSMEKKGENLLKVNLSISSLMRK
ncbi:MAG: hypothetical protein HYS98_08355 [Deltaproteobacteria bacterium]|nr:hypothetical protein [Deltaproteobacteria bacterium]